MRKQWIATLGILALMLAIGGRAEAAVTTCDPITIQHIVDTPAEAAAIGANDYNNTNCHLIIQVSIPIPPSHTVLVLMADRITIDPAGGPTPAVDVEIINDNVSSEIRLTTTTDVVGHIEITNGVLKAHKLLRFVAKEDVTARDSQLIAATVFGPPPSGLGGDFRIDADGNVDIQGTATHAGAILEWVADGSITFICLGGPTGCQDPLDSSKAVELCGTCPPGSTCPPDPRVPPTVFPCAVNFPTDASLREVCFPGGDAVPCDGGSKEKRFLARSGNINIAGTTLTSAKHITFTANNGNLLGAGANLTSTDDRIAFVIKGTIDLSDATLSSGKDIFIKSTNCPVPVDPLDPSDTCINANGATMTAATRITMATPGNAGVVDVCEATLTDGSGDPVLNGDTAPPYNDPPNRVVDTATECDDFVAPSGDNIKGPAVITP
ncbi:hypothetical protein MELA_01236 [Candidatus Methylomirabilis lanthanidiphila]|uniref:Uncharacterized protein n=1 Tax=Candidatus Methylomirabilis lanthanidiphila TaxID=2211376 RepID=A0A564ZHQ9_9BACT|nr:hypothetical protein [Candidatus Methylomirabilis lanthanidiphila]VUZ84861.1 hypothetical protein MELA_01236 [Candidatus Methylomirabilis lanthanidiphila]